jgi:hypothetical protein
MKTIFHKPPIVTILNNLEEINNYPTFCGSDIIILETEEIDALFSGKCLAWNDGEYSTFVVYKQAYKEGNCWEENHE